LQKEGELTHSEKGTLKRELKEMKSREGRLLKDYSELEEENLSLQRQVSVLKSAQVEFESAKHEISRLMDMEGDLQRQVEELGALKRIAEKQLEEALEALQVERENRYALKKELDAKINSESIMNLSNLALSLRGTVYSVHSP
jgi:protein bicaudal D